VGKSKNLKKWIDGCVPLLLIACLWVPQTSKAIARAFVWTNMQHWDECIMLPGWAYAQGQGLNTDIISLWGMGAVIAIVRCAQAIGGFDYSHVLKVLMSMAIVYYVFLYAFLRVWLRNTLLAVFAVAVAVKVQMFHAGISPLVWNFPQDTPARHWLDIPVLWCLWQHARSFQGKYLGWAAIGIAAAVAWVPSTGACLLIAFWGYLFFLWMVPEYRGLAASNFKESRWILICGVLPLIFMGLFLKNSFEPEKLFLQGVGVPSIYTCLFDRHFFAFIEGFAVPLIYAWTLIVIAGLAYSKKVNREDIFLVPLCVYGLALYMHYLANAATSHYYAVGIPLVMVVTFWFSKVSQRLEPPKALIIPLLLAIGAWGALLTNILFVYYPNIFNISQMDWRPEINFYQAGSHFDQDAAMIARLTLPTKGAALISSFETQILMQAKRKPFFYYAPLVTSQRPDVNGFAGTSIITQERLDKTLSQISRQSPEYIFIEKRLLGQWPAEYARDYPGIVLVLRYVVEHYSPQEQGMYLVAMHQK